VHEVEVDFLDRTGTGPVEQQAFLIAEMRLAGRVDLVKQLVEALARQLWQNRTDGPTDEVALSDHRQIARVGEYEAVLRTFEQTDQRGCFHEERVEPPALTLHLSAQRLLLLERRGPHAGEGELGADAGQQLTR